MPWLVRLFCPLGGTVLDPFLGSGSTVLAAAYEKRSSVGIERGVEYVRIARARIAHAVDQQRIIDQELAEAAEFKRRYQ